MLSGVTAICERFYLLLLFVSGFLALFAAREDSAMRLDPNRA
jgi:hypothetical protein